MQDMIFGLASYLAALRRFAGPRLVGALAITGAAALLEGVGIVLLLPLLAIATGDAGEGLGAGILDRLLAIGLDSEWSRGAVLVGGFVILMGLRSLVGWHRDGVLQRLGRGFVDHWRQRLFSGIAHSPWIEVAGLRRSSIEHALTSDVDRLAAGTDLAIGAVIALAVLLVQGAILLGISVPLAGLIFGLLLIGGMIAYPALASASRAGARLSSAGRDSYTVLGEFIEGQKAARIANALGEYLARYATALAEAREAELAYIALQAAARGWLQLIASCVVALVVLVGHFAFGAPAAVLALAVVVLARITGPIQVLLRAGQGMAYMLPAFAELRQLDAILARAASVPAEVAPDTAGFQGAAGLRFDDVTFGYGKAPVLRAASLAIAAGDFVALCGPSGAGKTTIADLACGLLVPSSGRVLADGLPLDDEERRAGWRGRIACVGQDAFLFDASLRDNLAFGAPASQSADIWQVLNAVGADDIIARLPMGLDTRVGPRGHFLSGGERQRICIARALLRRPGLLILDEATNALDSESEAHILTWLDAMRAHMTILLISHRSSAIGHAGRVLTLHDGSVTG